eukprot:CAMPEP_0170195436 /NCGR_PEP_ID=MMETSP0040_2-20121228/61533_1 /TAXON_ID=641309 /ORGANISM="Lotharella oceanica, Strain CCMP622" /LENGTH=61 /DNA_ID=CAMNT_0010444603 /DNA_START=8 /DNA_END=189 /DNA_ORIENTATION=-
MEKDFRAKLKAAKGKEKKRAVKEQQKAAEKEMRERHAKELANHGGPSAAQAEAGAEAPAEG